MSARTKIEVGDCFRIALPDGRWAYIQFVHRNDDFGYLVRVFDWITESSFDSTEKLEGAGCLFPPVFVGLPASVRSGRWQKIGNVPVSNFQSPKFRETIGTKPGIYQQQPVHLRQLREPLSGQFDGRQPSLDVHGAEPHAFHGRNLRQRG